MGKSIRHETDRSAPRNGEAFAMLVNGTGKKQVFRDRRLRRAKDARNNDWSRDNY